MSTLTVTMQGLDHNANTYLAVTLSPASPYFHDPSSLARAHPSAIHVGQVGELKDVQVIGVPKEQWDSAQNDILHYLKGREGVLSVDIQAVKARSKRGGDEL